MLTAKSKLLSIATTAISAAYLARGSMAVALPQLLGYVCAPVVRTLFVGTPGSPIPGHGDGTLAQIDRRLLLFLGHISFASIVHVACILGEDEVGTVGVIA